MQVSESRVKDITNELKKHGVEATSAAIEAVVNIMQERDCQYPEAVKIFTGKTASNGGTSQTKKPGRKTKKSASEGGNVVKNFADTMSDEASDKLADMIMAQTIQKTAQKLAKGTFGELTAKVMDDMKIGWLEPLDAELVALEGAEDDDDPKYLLPPTMPHPTEYPEYQNGSSS